MKVSEVKSAVLESMSGLDPADQDQIIIEVTTYLKAERLAKLDEAKKEAEEARAKVAAMKASIVGPKRTRRTKEQMTDNGQPAVPKKRGPQKIDQSE